MQQVLFLCTGNYYRSRMAEAYFNHLAEEHGLPFRADSRAILQDLSNTGNEGKIAQPVIEILSAINVPCDTANRSPICVTVDELDAFDVVVAMDDDEHRPMIEKSFARFAAKVNYLTVGDDHIEPVYVAVVKLIKQVENLVKTLAGVDKL
ncbi:low molecular weight phosphatase family protein [Vibrio sonorensis]|uniref:arsenate-mycothiol transferase ArsC n=1 Tax=Vibrio sonorensis TaxID=1004316 RepID=UPI000A071821|nr:hypothetical protein [Vibrio sonorensis]